MKQKLRTTFNQMKKAGAPVFEYKYGDERKWCFGINGEEEDGLLWLDWWGEFHGNYSWINPELEEIAKKNGMKIEWANGAVADVSQL